MVLSMMVPPESAASPSKEPESDLETSLLSEFRSASKSGGDVQISLLERSPSAQPLPECTCVALVKRGRYNEATCDAHKLTLRNSRPHPEPLGSPVTCAAPGNSPRRTLPSPSRTPLTALLTSAQPSSTPKLKMRESQSTNALPQRSAPRDSAAESVHSGAHTQNGLLLPSLSTTALLHLSPARSPSAGGLRTSPECKFSSNVGPATTTSSSSLLVRTHSPSLADVRM